MRYIFWIGIVPLLFGLKLLRKWIIDDFKEWYMHDKLYKATFPLRFIIAI